MRIVILGTGYVGLATGACFAAAGHHVTCVDVNRAMIATLNDGRLPIFEPGLADIIGEARRQERLSFSCDSAAAAAADAVFVAVGTPSRDLDGHADLSFVYAAVRDVAPRLKPDTVVVMKSTVPVGTGDQIDLLLQELRPGLEFEVASNPEFLRAGSAVVDFKCPDRVVIGTQTAAAENRLLDLYHSLGIGDERIVTTTRRSAELIKYAANGLLATKIAFVNELAELSEKVDARIADVARGIGLDRRIGLDCLQPGPGFGGSCFPKDARALAKMGEDHEAPLRIIETVLAVNEARKRAMVRKVSAAVGTLRGKIVAVWGLTFKAGTDDVRDAPSIPLIQALIDQGATVNAFDPQGMEKARAVLPRAVRYFRSAYDAVRGAHGVVVATEWEQFRELDLKRVRQSMRSPVVVDLRNLLDPVQLSRSGFSCMQIGVRPGVPDYVATLVQDVRARNRSRALDGGRKALRVAAEKRKLVAAE